MTTTKKLFWLAALAAAPAFSQCSAPYYVEQSFPPAGPPVTTWRICWAIHPQNGLIIRSAFFRKSPTSLWTQVLWDARVAEIFVKYHDGESYDDMGEAKDLADVSTEDCPSGVQLTGMYEGEEGTGLPNVCREIQDRLAWKEGSAVRRGSDLVLWASRIAGNYNYILEWTFRDDGVVVSRVGATAANNYKKDQGMMPHMHDAIFRMDVDLDGGGGDSVASIEHVESGEMGRDDMIPIPAECGMKWNQSGFTSLEISDATLTNGKHPTSYMLMPFLLGTARHTESFTQNDFWVTAYQPDQTSGRHVADYVNGENVSNTDVVVWYKGTLHHIPRDEDGISLPGSGGWWGETQIMWTGVILMPHNLFDATPFFPDPAP